MQLSRILTAPLVVDVRRGAVAGLGALLADQRIATEGRVAVAVGPSQGDSVLADLAPENLGAAEVFRVEDSTVDAAVHLGKQLRADAYEAVAGIGGGKTIDVTKFSAHMAGIPMVAVATNLSHDGIASPVSSLEHESGKGSYGVALPVAVLVDLDRVRAAPGTMAIAGIGDAISDLSAVADWELAAADTGEHVDGLAAAMADRLFTTSPIPARTRRGGPDRTRSRSTSTATGGTTPYELLPDSCSSELTGEAMPSCDRLVATATIGMPAMCAANLVTSMVLPPPMPTTAS